MALIVLHCQYLQGPELVPQRPPERIVIRVTSQVDIAGLIVLHRQYLQGPELVHHPPQRIVVGVKLQGDIAKEEPKSKQI